MRGGTKRHFSFLQIKFTDQKFLAIELPRILSYIVQMATSNSRYFGLAQSAKAKFLHYFEFDSLVCMKKLIRSLTRYFYQIKYPKLILWLYLIWYLVIVGFYFDPTPKIWVNAVGIGLVIGTALVLSVFSGNTKNVEPWQIFRLYLMPFCVSSFSALIKDQGFIIILSPKPLETLSAIFSCLIFTLGICLIKVTHRVID